MKILILSFYFNPDLCAGSFRATALVNALRAAVPKGSHIDVITTLPNRYKSFVVDAPQSEYHQDVSIHRIMLPSHQSGMLDQSLAFLSYMRQALRYVRSRNYDLILATSSRLMTAALGAWVAHSNKAGLYLDIRDIFVDTIKDVLPKHLVLASAPVLSLLERWTVNKADRVNLVSEGFADYFAFRYPHQKYTFFTNGIDEEFLTLKPMPLSRKKHDGIIKVVCAGNIGEGQGLHKIIPQLAKRMRGRALFEIIGDGGRRALLQDALHRAGVDNVELIPPISRDQLINKYRTADVLFLHLNDYDAFKKVLPSKLFEYAAMAKPIWAGLPGYSADFVRSSVSNAEVFDPCNAEAAEQALNRLVLQDTPRPEFIEKFSRATIMKKMAEDIIALAGSKRENLETSERA